SLAVVGRFIEEGAENEALAAVFASMPAEEQTATVIDGATVPGWELLPEEPMGWHYDGSLTTPGCTEGVSWYVVEETLEASTEQIAAFTAIFDHNYRPTQPLGEREVMGGTAEHAHWSYDGETGPAFWGELDEAWLACSEGLEQSPVNLSFDVSELAELAYITDMESLDYGDSSMTVLNNGHTVQVNIDAGNVISFDGVEYELKQFHFHADSEHTVDGEHAPMEMHMVHEN
ncbi:carbonic anhydrase family protein, partial [bacterium]|nr:carbonic anhydrase family protein [bacterium]